MAMRRQRKKSGAPLDQCDPAEMVQILLSRLKECEFNEDQRSALCGKLNDLSWYFEKHPEHVEMFRTDLLEWRTLLKQSKSYIEDSFDAKMSRTEAILDYVMGKPKTTQKKVIKKQPQFSYYQILFRPGMRSIRQYPINEEHYGEHNKDVDELHKQIASLREEIIYAPQNKVSRAEKKELLELMLSIVEICAYDVLDGVGIVKEVRALVCSIVEGEEFRKKTNIVNFMSSLTLKLKEKAMCHWMEGQGRKRKMWENIKKIEEGLERANRPKFKLDVLANSEFLKVEKMKEIAEGNVEPVECKDDAGDLRKIQDEELGKQESMLEDEPCSSLSLGESSSLSCLPKRDKSLPVAKGCENANYRLSERIVQEMNLHSGSGKKHSRFVCSSQEQPKPKTVERQPERPGESLVTNWADRIIATYSCKYEVTKVVDDGAIREESCVPDEDVEENTLFKSKSRADPRGNFGVLKHVVIPPPPEDTDFDKTLAEIVRVDLKDDNRQRESLELPHGINPTLGRRRLLKY